MAGLYLHIPFCSRRCFYCDFFSSTDNEKRGLYIAALCCEIDERKGYLADNCLSTIYFGGGTPSLLSAAEFEAVFATIARCFAVDADAEITLEANPDDLSEEYLSQLRQLPFNRISLGIQSFNDDDLKRLNRRHSACQAKSAMRRCREAGFDNISIDLMYGLPGQSVDDWERNIEEAIALNPEHISAYSLTYEEGTELHRRLKSGRVKAADDETSRLFYDLLADRLEAEGYLHYEISNFAKPGFVSRHNSSYWKGIGYLGVGAAAHSYSGESRQWNVASLAGYLSGHCVEEVEMLDTDARYNDYLITRLRTAWGVDADEIAALFGSTRRDSFCKTAESYLATGLLVQSGVNYRLTRDGFFISDGIIADFFALT